MYTSYIGKKYLRLYNERHGGNLSAQEFFEQEMFPLFFDDERHLMHVGNSAFFYGPDKEKIKAGMRPSEAQLAKLQADIVNEPPNMSTFVGYGAKDMQGTTSGQMTHMSLTISPDEMYASWIGQALGIGVNGGFVMLIDEPEVLHLLAEGWRYYRETLRQTPEVKGRQIETWNGQWLCHALGERYDPDYPLDDFEVEAGEVQGNVSLPTVSWVKVIFNLARRFAQSPHTPSVMTAYAYNLSQTNTTLGFINLYLHQVRLLYEMRDRLFVDHRETALTNQEIERLEPFFGFKGACMLGTLGLRALEPDKLRSYMPKGTFIYAQGKDFKFSNDASYQTYYLFKTWIIAMLNKTELLDLAAQVAKALHTTQTQPNDRGKTTKTRLVDDVREAKSLKAFIESLTALLHEEAGDPETFHQVVEHVLKMPSDNFPLFITLIRFELQYLKSKTQA